MDSKNGEWGYKMYKWWLMSDVFDFFFSLDSGLCYLYFRHVDMRPILNKENTKCASV